MENVYFTDVDFEITEVNPFDDDRLYDHQWVILKLVNDPNGNMIVGKGNSKVYEVTISKCCEGWEYRTIDFINYNIEQGHKIVCSIEKTDYNHAKEIYQSTNHLELRYYEPKVLVHSTLPEYISLIKESGCLKSWNRLKMDSIIKENKPLGNILGDPLHFSDYIMLGGGFYSEIVVLSKQLKRIEMNIDLEYKPGGRFYFDTSKLVRDGLLVRDGIHYKVKDELPLDKYLFCLITPQDVQFGDQLITPRNFSKFSDQLFERKFNMKT